MGRLVVIILLLLLAFAAPASGQGTQLGTGSVKEAVDAFKSGDPVYVDPDVRERLPRSQEEGLEEQIGSAGGRIFIALFPSSAGTVAGIGAQLIDGTRQDGTYGVVLGNNFQAASNVLPAGEAARLARESAQGNSVSQGLGKFVSAVSQARSSSGAASGSGGGAEPSGGNESGGGSFLPILGIAALAF